MCIKSSSGFECTSSLGKDTGTLGNELLGNTGSMPDGFGHLLSIASIVQAKLFPCLLAGAGVVFFCCFVALKRSFKKPNPNRPSRPKLFQTATVVLGGIAVALSLASAVATTQTAGALDFATSSVMGCDNIRLVPGVPLQILQWLIVGFSVLFQLAISSMFRVGGSVVAAGPLPLPASAGPPGPPGRYPPEDH